MNARASDLTREKASIKIGKNGLTKGIIGEVADQVTAHGAAKVKADRSAYGELGRKEFFQLLAKETGFHLVEVRGNTAILSR